MGFGAPAMNTAVSALRFFYIRTLDCPALTRKLHRVEHPRGLPTVLSRDEVSRMLNATTSIKHQAILSVAYGAGLRAVEVPQGPGHRQRTHVAESSVAKAAGIAMPCHARSGPAHPAARMVEDRAQGGRDAPRWLAAPGMHYLKPISTRQEHRIAAEAAHSAGITKRVGPHTLRHIFATHLLEDGVDVCIIQVLLGHSQLQTTTLYTRVATKTEKAVGSPLDRLGMLPGAQGSPPG